MSEINSPLGRRQLATQSPRILNVPDEESIPLAEPQFVSQVRPIQKSGDELDTARKLAVENRKRVSPAAKERIEFLMNLGRGKLDVTVDDVVFSLQSLRDNELKNALMAGSKGTTRAEAMFEIRKYTLAYAIEKIDGQTFAIIIGDDDIEIKADVISKMDESLIEHLHNSYEEMIRKNKEKFAIKTEGEAKEVVEDLKKS